MHKTLRTAYKNQRGSALVYEATIIFPFIFLVMASLIFVGLYTLQRACLYSQAEKIAVYASKVQAIPGYEFLYTPDAKSIDSPTSAGSLSGKVSAMQKIHDPYRYWNFKYSDGPTMEKYLEDFITKNSFVNIYNTNCSVTTAGIPMISQRINVSITATMKLPQFIRMFGQNEAWDFEVTSTAMIMDTAEFIRNTNMAFDLSDFLLEKFHVSKSIDKYMQRVKDIGSRWFGLGG